MAPDRVFKFFGYCPTDDGELICTFCWKVLYLYALFASADKRSNTEFLL